MTREVKTKPSLEPGSRPTHRQQSNEPGQSHLGWLEHMIINAFNDTWNEWPDALPDANLFIWGSRNFFLSQIADIFMNLSLKKSLTKKLLWTGVQMFNCHLVMLAIFLGNIPINYVHCCSSSTIDNWTSRNQRIIFWSRTISQSNIYRVASILSALHLYSP